MKTVYDNTGNGYRKVADVMKVNEICGSYYYDELTRNLYIHPYLDVEGEEIDLVNSNVEIIIQVNGGLYN